MDSLKRKNILVDAYKKFLIDWNNRFPLDRKFRKKYNIAFNSESHRNLNQVDIFLDLLEDSMVEKQRENYIKYTALGEEIDRGEGFLISQEERMTEEEKDDAFEKLRKGIKKKINNDNAQ